LVWLLHRSLYLTPGRMQFLVKVFPRFAKFVHALPRLRVNSGNFLAPNKTNTRLTSVVKEREFSTHAGQEKGRFARTTN
jgi:hypothetical protein